MTSILKADTIQDTDGNNIINESSDTITIGASGDTIALAGTTVTGITQGITMADQWRITASSSDSSGQDITTNWSRSGHTAYGQLGTGMTESSGIFTFPSTGIYSVIVQAVTQARNGDMNQGEVYLKATTNNSSYDIVSQAENQCGQNKTASVSFQALIDVTDTSNVKVKIATLVSGGTDMRLLGASTQTRTGITFIRLGDT